MNKRTCTMPECGKPHVARGLCATHYNQTHQPDRHKKRMVECVVCGTEVMRSSGGGRKYGATCSNQCRDATRKTKCVLPADHWARWYGATSSWTPPAVKALLVMECGWCGSIFETNQPHRRYCGTPCSRRASKARRRAREHEATGEYTWTQVMRLHLLAGRRCSYCDALVVQPEPDHVIPLSRGGRNDLNNILPCCRACNAEKNDMTPIEWAIWRANRGKSEVRTSFNHTDPRFVHLMLGQPTGESKQGRCGGRPLKRIGGYTPKLLVGS